MKNLINGTSSSSWLKCTEPQASKLGEPRSLIFFWILQNLSSKTKRSHRKVYKKSRVYKSTEVGKWRYWWRLMASIESVGGSLVCLIEVVSRVGRPSVPRMNATADRSRVGRRCYCIIMPLSLMANDPSFLKKIKMTLWEISNLGLGKGKWKPNIFLLNFTV